MELKQEILGTDPPKSPEGKVSASEICRLCEKRIDISQLLRHSSVCLVGNNLAIKVSELDSKISELLDDLDTCIYWTSTLYLRGRDTRHFPSEETSRIVRDEDFPLLRKIAKICHEALKFNAFSTDSLCILRHVIKEITALLHDEIEKYFYDLVQKILDLLEKKADHFQSALSACIALAGSEEGEEAEQIEEEVASSFSARYSNNLCDFEFVKPISRGSFGQVFLARKVKTGDIYAIKVQKKDHIVRKNHTKRVEEEHTILAKTYNPFIVKLYYSFQTEEYLYLVMEYLPGGDCLSLLENVGYLDESTAKVYIAETLLALEYLHQQGIIHRDLKPDNMLISAQGHIKLTDFGLSAWAVNDSIYLPELGDTVCEKPSVPPKYDVHFRRNQMFSCVGTPDYLSPEVLQGIGYGTAADLWSLGVILYEFLVGVPPFSADTPEEVFRKILDESTPISWPEEIPISDAAKDLVSKLVERDWTKRPSIKEIKKHPFFEGIDWENLLFSDSVPFKPVLKQDDDTTYFGRQGVSEDTFPNSELKKHQTKRPPAKKKPVEIGFSHKFPKDKNTFALFAFRNLLHLDDENEQLLSKKFSGSSSVASSPGAIRDKHDVDRETLPRSTGGSPLSSWHQHSPPVTPPTGQSAKQGDE